MAKVPSWYKGDPADFETLTNSKVPSDPKKADGSTDYPQLFKDLAVNGVSAATTALVPEVAALSPLKNLLMKMGISFTGGTGVDQLLNNVAGNKPLLNSAVDAGVNTLAGIGLPELLNVGINPRGIQRTSTTTRGPTTSERTSSGSSTRTGVSDSIGSGTSNNQSSGTNSGQNVNNYEGTSVKHPQLEPKLLTVDPITGRQLSPPQEFMIPRPGASETNSASNTISNHNTSHNNSSSGTNSRIGKTTSTGGSNYESSSSGVSIPGISQTVRDAPLPGIWGHLLELASHIESTKRLRANGAPILSPLQSALAGFGLNGLFDTTANRPQQ